MKYNEADTRAKLIDPVLHKIGWTEDLIRREVTAGTIEMINGRPKRKKGRTDYLLCLPGREGDNPLPIAVLESKSEYKHASVGLDQAKEYAKAHNTPFVFSSNGHLFVGYDHFEEKVSDENRLEHFPTPPELRKLYEEKKGFSLDDEKAKPLFVPYKGGQSERRYYQDAAIRAALEKIASKKRGWNRVLISAATGSGKTRIAVQLLHKFAESGHLKRALFVCDRNELRRQGFGKLFSVFGDNVGWVKDRDPQKNARIIVATYQALCVDEEGDQSFFLENYPENYFSHIIIDECHRSAWDKWSIILKNNSDAVQIGLTATPRRIEGESSDALDRDEEISRNNIRYFGEPVYEYPYVKAWEDGYLSVCEIVKRVPDIDDRFIVREELLEKGVYDAKTGRLMFPEDVKDVYEKSNFDKQLILPDRRRAMCKDLLDQFEKTGGLRQKTIIFCVNDKHAEDVANDLNNMYKDRGLLKCEKFAFKCTQKGIASGTLGESQETLIANMRGMKSSHFIATTVDLLTTGVDIPCIKNIVFFVYLKSPILFYQMFGRGTRIDETFDKYMFRVYDYTNATRLFGKDFISKPLKKPSKPEGPKEDRKIAKVEGYTVEMKDEGIFILMKDEETGKDRPYSIEEYKQKLAVSLIGQVENIDLLRQMWVNPADRMHLVDALPGGEKGALMLRKLLKLDNCDLFDFFAEVGFGVAAKTRAERVTSFDYKNRGWLMSLPPDSASVIKAVAKQFKENGIEELESPTIFDISEVKGFGGVKALSNLGMSAADIITDVKIRLLVA